MFLKIAGLILAGYALVFGLFCVVAFQNGIAIVDVTNHRSGKRIFLPAPMVLANIGVSLIPDHALRDVQRELGPHRQLAEVAIDELRSCPDGPFVEVDGKEQHVLVEKRGDNIVVSVESPNEDVFIKVPLRGAKKLIAQLTAARD
jgi:hypothetical protein